MYEANKANLLGRVMLFLVIIASYRVSLGIAPACAESVPASKAEVDALKNDLKSINSSLESIQKELEFIRQLLTQRPSQPRQPAPTIANVSLSGNPMLGNKDAPITLIEFSDYQCPYCAQLAQAAWPSLKAEYIDTGKVRYVFRDFPLDHIHLHARKVAEAAHCTGDQGKFWEMHDVLFHNRQALDERPPGVDSQLRNPMTERLGLAVCIEPGFAGRREYIGTVMLKESEHWRTVYLEGPGPRLRPVQ
jgi:protein-disulfide isomerase